jgi:uncharacterized protein
MPYDFEWDERKNQINRIKHGIDFADAIHVFFDERLLTRTDEREDYGEVRVQAIGMSSERVLFVVYTERHENTIRMISARKASKSERSTYERGIF